ncbi:LuxR C-terminal-related transcriptional regulator [Kitasatospora cinereorecta]|uniref:LuxR C-terminal-related transcriptional regulator n=1 Tax=Kitasatospora cinereorecta TaxID=285560 RepID=A0ABW0VN14_9ACTN
MLAMLGVDAAAEQVYRAMLAHPDAGVAELAGHLAVPEDEVRAGLDRLSALALVTPSHEHVGRLRAVSPEVGLELLMARQQAELAAHQERIAASRAAAARLIAEFADLRPTAEHPGVEHLVGIDRIRERLGALSRQVRDEVMTFAPDGAHTAESISAARPLNEALLARGVRMRTVYLDSVRNSPRTAEYVGWLGERGAQVRTAATLPTRIIIQDRAIAVIPVNSDDSAAGAVVLSGQGTLAALCALFESVWEQARPFGAPDHRACHELTPQQATAVRLLADGLTDEAIAKRLGVSPRTARRLAGDLMERLGARSRFEAGVRAVQQGWLPAQP